MEDVNILWTRYDTARINLSNCLKCDGEKLRKAEEKVEKIRQQIADYYKGENDDTD